MIEELLQTPNLPDGISFSAGYVTLDSRNSFAIEELLQAVESARDRARMENKPLCQGYLMTAEDLSVEPLASGA